MSASPMESMAIVATGVSTQVGSVGVAEELDGGNSVTEELDWLTAVSELELAASAELAGSCSVEELEI